VEKEDSKLKFFKLFQENRILQKYFVPAIGHWVASQYFNENLNSDQKNLVAFDLGYIFSELFK